MTEIVLKFTSSAARSTEYFLRRRYKSKAGLAKLAKVAVLREAAQEAQKDIEPEFITRGDGKGKRDA